MAISIIIILAGIMVAVGSSVQKNARINETRATLKALEGIIEKYEAETNTRLVGITSGSPPTLSVVGTIYADAAGIVLIDSSQYSSVSANNYVNILYRHPATKELMASLGGKLKTSGTFYYIVDSWGTPIHFIPQGWTPGAGGAVPSITGGSDFAPAARMYLRSSGPDRQCNFKTATDASNNDDIYSYEP